jgi:hypothetical protein
MPTLPLRSSRQVTDPPVNEVDAATCVIRVQELHALTHTTYHELRRIVYAIVPRRLCDPEDALNEGLLIALKKYAGLGKLTWYVPRCAFFYALYQAQKRKREVAFTDLQADNGRDDDLDNVLPYLEDPRYVEAVDEVFVQRIEEIIAALYDRRLRYATHRAKGDAVRILALFRENANLGRGIGVDEYENTPPSKVRLRGKPTHDTKLVRGLILDHLRDEMGVSRKDANIALKALRVSTHHALREGWLPN